jgi:hypothetical protein
MRRIIIFFWLVCGAGVILATAQRTEQPDASSCRRFAQQFYDWYAPLTQKEAATPSWDVALEQKSELFSAQLVKLLKADSLARSKAQGELVGLDFDPFVGGQDPADHYDVRRVSVKSGTNCFVQVWRNSPNDTSEKSLKPDVVAALLLGNANWHFVNFRYPAVNTDLLKTLAQLRRDRHGR